MRQIANDCPAGVTLRAIGGRWKVILLWHLFAGPHRFSELQRVMGQKTAKGVTPKMLTQELREMERDGLVHREIYREIPPRVEYWLTPLGESLRPVVDAMVQWGEQRMADDVPDREDHADEQPSPVVAGCANKV